MKKTVVILLFVISTVCESYSQIVINEVMYAPSSPNKEWFEIYNTGTVAINIQNWKWRDAAITNPIRTITTNSVIIPANSYAIVCEDSVNLRTAFPNISGTILQSIGWNALNNTGNENVVLYNSSLQTSDSLTYSNTWGGGTGGYSLERINPFGATNSQLNWGTCISPNKATPNNQNSLTPKQYDLFLKTFSFLPVNPVVGDSLKFSFQIKNIGLNSATNFSLNIYRDLNFDSIPQQNELINTQNFNPFILYPNDSLTYIYNITNIDSGLKQYVGIIVYSLDQDTTNNKLVRSVNVGGGGIITTGIIINEVMYAPASPNKEWFEIYNTSSNTINIKNWKWRDAATSNPIRTITTNDVLIPQNSYAIICEDSLNLKSVYPNISGIILQSIGWSALNNTGNENIVLYNQVLNISDSLTYNDTWGGATGGYSLERIIASNPTNNQNNWGTCISINKATPNTQNSLTPKQYDLSLKSFTLLPVNPLVGDSLKFTFQIKNIGLNSATNFSLNIYRDLNFDSIPQQNELLNSQNYNAYILNPNDSLTYIYNIANIDSGLKQYIGLIVYTQDQDSTNNKLIRSVNPGGSIVTNGIIINEIMYAPQNPEPEWVEIYNNSSNAINIKNWKISDETGQNNPIVITSSDRNINSHDYLVISKTNAILQVHTLIDTSRIIYLSNLPTLNNDRDKVIIFNNNNSIVDEVDYKSNWGGSSRSSIERISVNRPTNDSTNWATSLDCEFSTPTRTNSVANLTGNLRNDLVINEIMFDPITGSAEWLEFYNPTYKYLNLTGWKINVSSSAYNLYDTCNYIINPGQYLVFSADTTIYNRFPYLKQTDPTRKILFNKSLGLSNEGAMIKILDVLNNTIDSVYYSPKWHNNNIPDTKGYSLERINPSLNSNDKSNWNSCTAQLGGTPGTKNSIYTANANSSSNLNVFPNPFSPDGDGHEDFTIINYKITPKIAQLRVKIFDVKGRLVRTLYNNQLSGTVGQIIFDGKNDNGEKLRIGIYIIFLEAVDDKGGIYESLKTTVVVAAKL